MSYQKRAHLLHLSALTTWKSNTLRLLTLLAALTFATTAAAEIEKVAAPRDYTPIEQAQIGTREDGLGVKNGHQIGDVTLEQFGADALTLSDLWNEQPLLIVFYRGGWCPFCNTQIKEMSDNYGQFEKLDVLPVFISVDKPDVASLTSQTYSIPFPVLSDTALSAHTEFNVVNKISDEQRARMAKRGLDFDEWSGSNHGVIAHASTFLVDSKGVVQWSTVVKDYRSRPTLEQLLAAIQQWKSNP